MFDAANWTIFVIHGVKMKMRAWNGHDDEVCEDEVQETNIRILHVLFLSVRNVHIQETSIMKMKMNPMKRGWRWSAWNEEQD